MNSYSGRTRPRIMPSSLSLPQNTIADILSRLPVKSLTRFKSVSKHWSNLTSSPAFIAAHLRRSSTEPYLLIRRYNSQSGWEYGIWLVSNPSLDFTTKLLRVPAEESLPRFPRIIGVVDGLVCLDISLSFTSDFVMWNPGTRLFKHLAPPLITYTKDNPIWMVFHGFGYDSFNEDHKLVRIVSFRGDESPSYRVEVYSLTECVWKEIGERFESALLCGGQEGVVVDGCLNWAAIGLQGYADRKVVISFDMAREVFKTIALPAVTRDGDIKVMSYMGLLAVAVYPLVCPGDDNEMDRFEFWVQRDCEDGSKCWTLMVSIGNFSKNLIPVGTWRDREVVFKHMGSGVTRDRDNHSSLLLFDPVDRSTKTVPIDCVDFCCEGYNYVESLMSVN